APLRGDRPRGPPLALRRALRRHRRPRRPRPRGPRGALLTERSPRRSGPGWPRGHRRGLDLRPGSNPYREGMDALTIADAAEATGFTPSALRFYEAAGLVRPQRTAAGYRSYGDKDLARLRFI